MTCSVLSYLPFIRKCESNIALKALFKYASCLKLAFIMQFHKSYISIVQHFKRLFLINKAQYSSPDSPGCVLREGIKCYGSWNSWNRNFPVLSAALLFWESRGCDQQNACSREGCSWQGGAVAKWHFGCSCFHVSPRDHVSARSLPESIPCTHKSHHLCCLQEVQ